MALAIKTLLGLSWTQHRLQKRILRKEVGLTFEGEAKERQERNKMLARNLKEDKISAVEKNESKDKKNQFTHFKAPVVFVENLTKFACELLNEYQEGNKLIWHEGMPKDEIWIKVGGDHGGKSLKLCMQICNLQCPNAKENTVVFSCTTAKDYHHNLEQLTKLHTEQLNNLQNTQWNGKTIKVFLFGDYAFLCSLFGLSGQNGTHPCLWCLIKKSDLQVAFENRGQCARTTLSKIKRDHEKFEAAGSQLKLASSYNNVIHKPLLDIHISHVSPPYLHILLGIVKKHHDLFENDLHELDLALANDPSIVTTLVPDNSPLYTYIQNLKNYQKLLAKLGFLEYQLSDDDSLTETEKRVLEQKVKLARKEVSNGKPVLELYNGPLVQQAQTTLRYHKIVQQAYHSRSFVGNHCSKYIQQNVQNDLEASLLEKICELSSNAAIYKREQEVTSKYFKLNTLFLKVHTEVAGMNFIPEVQRDNIEVAIDKYLKFYRRKFPYSVIPKQHFLEDHISPWIRRWGFGMAMHGEHGGESIHREFNRISRCMYHIADPSKKLYCVMKEHHTLVRPELRKFLTTPRKRKHYDKQ